MKFDLISDIHADFYIRKYDGSQKSKNLVTIFVEDLIPDNKNEILICAGDISHYNNLSINVLTEFKKYYKHVIITGGNHDMYIVSNSQKNKYKNSFNRLNELKEMCLENDIIFLDGDVVEIDNIKFGGLTGWYNLPNKEDIEFWKEYLNDSRLIKGFDTQKYFYEQIEKLKNLKDIDVLISHVIMRKIPDEFMNYKYVGNKGNIFYYSDTEELVNETGCKIHIFGHVHDKYNFSKDGIKYISNPLGYPGENYTKIIEVSYEIWTNLYEW